MTEFLDETLHDDAVEEALARIDQGLTTLTSRELLSASEVSDLLLDLRLLLMTSGSASESVAEAAEPAVSSVGESSY